MLFRTVQGDHGRGTSSRYRKVYLTPEQPTERNFNPARSLLKPIHFYCLAVAMAEEAKQTGARLFFMSHNLHLPEGSPAFAVKTASEAVRNLAHDVWDARLGANGSWLGKDAAPFRPRCVLVPERAGAWHAHGLLLVPRSIRWSTRRMLKSLRRLPVGVGECAGGLIHETAVHLALIKDPSTMRCVADYATGSWRSEPNQDRIVEYATSGRWVSRDYHGINQRAAELIEEFGRACQIAARHRAERTAELLFLGHAARCAVANKVRVDGKRSSARSAAQIRAVAIPPALRRSARVPWRARETGFVEWNELLCFDAG